MTREFRLPSNEGGLDVYGILYNPTSKAFNGSTFETYATGNYDDYDLAATGLGVGGTYVIDMPATVTDAGVYEMFFYVSESGARAEGDRWLGSVSVDWTGTEVGSTVASDDNDLISLAELKEYLKITTTNENAILQTLIHDVSDWIQKYLNRNLVSQDYTEYYSGDGDIELQLKNYPITDLASLNIDNNRYFYASTVIDAANYILKKKRGVITAFNLFGGFVCGESNIKVVYTAGFTVGEDSDSGTMPHDIRLAVKRLIDRHFRHGYTNRKLDVDSESISGMNITFKKGAMPEDVAEMLKPWRKLFPAPQYEYAD